MLTYALLTLPFLAAAVLLDVVVLKTRVTKTRNFWVVVGIMLGFTLVFDQLFTGLPIVFYDTSLTSGIKLWHAPIEDFSYTIAACIGIGAAVTYAQKHHR